MDFRKLTFRATLFLLIFGLLIGPALAKGPSLEKMETRLRSLRCQI